MKGSLTVIAGPMFSGKTEELQRRVRRLAIAGKEIVVFKPIIDNRYSDREIVSHNKNSVDCISVNHHNAEVLFGYIDWHNTEIVAIDEVQFFDKEIVSIIERFIEMGIHVIVAGLNLDSWNKPFGSMPELLARADHIEKLSAVCKKCKKENATLSQLLEVNSSTSDHIVVGGKD
ncbi:MAG: thymidine kinase, partial [Candidatus Spechtbacterales bacterium]|nr:thymidine kinase [Candidatus Spechtbacterales bacterium]